MADMPNTDNHQAELCGQSIGHGLHRGKKRIELQAYEPENPVRGACLIKAGACCGPECNAFDS